MVNEDRTSGDYRLMDIGEENGGPPAMGRSQRRSRGRKKRKTISLDYG